MRDAAQRARVPGRQREAAAVRRVDVQPQATLRAQIRELVERIERAGRGRARRGDHPEHAAIAGLAQRAHDRVGRQPVMRVDRRRDRARVAQAHHPQRARDRVVRFVGGHDRERGAAVRARAPRVEAGARLAHREQRGQVAERATRGQRTARARRQPSRAHIQSTTATSTGAADGPIS